MIKLSRKTLLIIVAVLGVILILFGVLRHFSIFQPGEEFDKYFTNGIIIAAIGLFIYNRKLIKDEKLAKEAEEKIEKEAEKETENDDAD